MDKNFKLKIEKYTDLKQLIYDNNLDYSGFMLAIKNRTDVGKKIIDIFKVLSDGEDIANQVAEFADYFFERG